MLYDISGNLLRMIYDISGSPTDAYNVNGELVFREWDNEITIDKSYDEQTTTYYYAIRIPQTRADGSKQYPFLYAPNGIGQATQSTLTMNREKGFYLAINAGIGGTYTVQQGVLPIGCLIENGVLLQQGSSEFYILTINDSGLLEYHEPNTDGNNLISDGAVSAVVGFVPIVENGESVSPSIYETMPHDDEPAQRQIIGQYPNGDYAILTCEGRGYDSSTGWTIPQAISVCLSLGLQFAYNLDGGGSTETVLGNEQINIIYEGTTGRKVQNFIVFNGSDTFFVPE